MIIWIEGKLHNVTNGELILVENPFSYWKEVKFIDGIYKRRNR
jgi:hypothetical protein